MADFIVEGESPIDPSDLKKAKDTIKSALERSLGTEKNLIDAVSNHANDIKSLTLNLKSASSTMQWYQRNYQSTDTNSSDQPSNDKFDFLNHPRWSEIRSTGNPLSSEGEEDQAVKKFLQDVWGNSSGEPSPSLTDDETSQPNDWVLPDHMKPRDEVSDTTNADIRDSLNDIAEVANALSGNGSGNQPPKDPPSNVVTSSDDDDDEKDIQSLKDIISQQWREHQSTVENVLESIEDTASSLSQENPAEQINQINDSNSIDIENSADIRNVDTLDDVLVNDVLDASSSINRSADHIVNASETIDRAADSLEDIIDNNTFNPGDGGGNGGGGDGGDDDPYELPEDGGNNRRRRDGNEEQGLTLEDIVGKTGKFAVQAYLGKVVANTIGAVANSIGSAINQMGQTAVQAIGSPGSVSPVNQATAPIRTSSQIVGATGGLIGAGIGTAIAPGPGTVIGGLIGSVIGDKFTAAVGGMLDILISIDDNIKNLGNDLRPFSVDILSASVEDTLAQLEARMNQAQELGPLLAENIRARTQFELAVRDLGTEMSKLFLPFLTSLTNLSTDILEAITGNLETLIAVIKGVFTAIGTAFPWLNNLMTGILTALQIIQNNTKPQKTPAQLKEIQDFIEQSAMGQINAGNQGVGTGPSFPTIPGTLGVTF